jgi:hypothetical protein
MTSQSVRKPHESSYVCPIWPNPWLSIKFTFDFLPGFGAMAEVSTIVDYVKGALDEIRGQQKNTS